MLNKLREKANNLYLFTKEDNYLNILSILECEDCFFKMEVDVALSIIMDLGFKKEEAKKIYVKLINKGNVEEFL